MSYVYVRKKYSQVLNAIRVDALICNRQNKILHIEDLFLSFILN